MEGDIVWGLREDGKEGKEGKVQPRTRRRESKGNRRGTKGKLKRGEEIERKRKWSGRRRRWGRKKKKKKLHGKQGTKNTRTY